MLVHEKLYLLAVGCDSPDRVVLVFGHQPAVANDVRMQDGGEVALGRHQSATRPVDPAGLLEACVGATAVECRHQVSIMILVSGRLRGLCQFWPLVPDISNAGNGYSYLSSRL